MAQNRFSMLERRLNRCPELKEGYVNFMKEYEALGHMSPLQSFDSNMRHFFIPHHCVHRPQSLSTKLRVVFDGSAKSTSGKSLNDLLLCGPTIQQDLITTVLAFRLHRFVLTGDITKMYRQFMIDPRDRLFQLILWRENPTDPMKVYQLNTVTYGLSSAPFLAIRSLQYLASESRSEFPAGASVLCNDLYVDDLLTGADTVEELLEKKRQVVQILRKGNMSMSKFNSNSHIIGGLSATEVAIKFEEEEITKALGLSWQPQKDYFVYRYDLSSDNTFTKRIVLSTIASLFDALGLLSPVTIRCKILLQDLHILKLGWDEPLPDTQNELFIGRRGLPSKLYCDNATNFCGAARKMDEFKQQFFSTEVIDDLHSFSAVKGFDFNFIPPRAPHFGGALGSRCEVSQNPFTEEHIGGQSHIRRA
nr:uncharacterized protein LOC108054643 [Drosophila takahashii]